MSCPRDVHFRDHFTILFLWSAIVLGFFLMAINTNDSPSLLGSYSNNVQSKLNYNKFINPDKEQVTGTFHSKVAEHHYGDA